jgi:NodT family efflux transporter outer membrane factor (OMF) lipoprotein
VRRALAIAAAALAAGCSLVPPFMRPDAPVPQAWRQPAAEQGVFPERDWWRAFGSAELEALVARAEANNYDLRAAASRIAQAQAQTRIARSALLPSLDASGQAARDWLRFERSGGVRRTSAESSFQGSFAASWEADLWGRNRAGLLSAEASLEAARLDREALALSLLADVTANYLQYLSLGDRIDTARKQIANARRILELVERREQFGATSALEVAQQRAGVAALQANLPPLAQARAQTLNALAALVGEPPERLALRMDSLDGVALPQIAPGLPSALLERRPDIRRAEAQLAAANADIGAARAAFYPSIALTADAGVTSTALSRLVDGPGLFAGIAASALAPIFSAGRLEGQEEAAEARYAELAELYRGTVVQAFRDVEDALAAARFLREAEAAQVEQVRQAQAAYDLAEVQYRGGAIDFLTVLDVQRTLFQAEDALLQTRFARLAAAVDLFRALGGGY